MLESEKRSVIESVRGTRPRVGGQFSLWSRRPSPEGQQEWQPEPGPEPEQDGEWARLLMREVDLRLRLATDLFGESVSEFAMALARLEALEAGFSERLTFEGGRSLHDD